MSEETNNFFSLSSKRISDNIKRKKTIANDPVIDDVKTIISESVRQFGDKVMSGKMPLEPKDFEKFAKLYLAIITQENDETSSDEQEAENLREDTKQFESLKNMSSFKEITNKMAEMMEEKNQSQLSTK